MEDARKMMEAKKWDKPTIILHWGMAGSAILLLVTGIGSELVEEAVGKKAQAALHDVHFYLGLLLIISVAGRIVWGFFGPETIRWTAMIKNAPNYPAWARAEIDYLLTGADSDRRKKTGHNALAIPVYLFALFMFFVQAASGLLMWSAEKKEKAAEGQAYTLFSPAPAHAYEINTEKDGHDDHGDGAASMTAAGGHEHGEDEGGEFLEEVHETGIFWLPLFLALHLGGMFLHRMRGEREIFSSMSPF